MGVSCPAGPAAGRPPVTARWVPTHVPRETCPETCEKTLLRQLGARNARRGHPARPPTSFAGMACCASSPRPSGVGPTAHTRMASAKSARSSSSSTPSRTAAPGWLALGAARGCRSGRRASQGREAPAPRDRLSPGGLCSARIAGRRGVGPMGSTDGLPLIRQPVEEVLDQVQVQSVSSRSNDIGATHFLVQ